MHRTLWPYFPRLYICSTGLFTTVLAAKIEEIFELAQRVILSPAAEDFLYNTTTKTTR